jgi:indole-3-glycerol phosphate synthase
MASKLDQIVAATRSRLALKRRAADMRALERRAADHLPRGFRRGLAEVAAKGIAVIAELKKASPSKGLIRASFDPEGLARELAEGGAAALSVLTEPEFFQGSLDNLRIASEASGLPCLRKDFIVDELQIIEARAHCADAVLLIVAALEQPDLEGLAARARAQQLDVLCEAHDEEELQRALDAGCTLIGVNSRNLRTFQVDLRTAHRLAKKFPSGILAVAESGIGSPSEIAELRAAGYEAFLIGETLMKAAFPGSALRRLLGAATVPSGTMLPCWLRTDKFSMSRGRNRNVASAWA